MSAPPLPPLREALDWLAEQLDEAQQVADGLGLAIAASAAARLGGAALPPQLVVFGPTQSGKSTMVNWLLDAPLASASPLAGHTRHAQAFDAAAAPAEVLAGLFPGHRLCAPAQLPEDELRALGWAAVAPGPLGAITVWDSPDFDSIAAGGYRDAVARSIGLADALVLALSKDKYADRRVWSVLAQVQALGTPLLVCVNKLGEGDREPVIEALLERLAALWGASALPPVVAMPWLAQAEQGGAAEPIEVAALRKASADLLHRAERRDRRVGLQRLIDLNWPRWSAPLCAASAARGQWRAAVEAQGEAMAAHYGDEFLRHSGHYETFQRCLGELIALLEIPVMGGLLGQARSVITWPARRLMGLAGLGERGDHDPDDSLERRLLLGLHRGALNALAELALERAAGDGADGQWWRALAAALRAGRPALERAFDERVLAYQRDFAPQIQAAAEELYQGLQEQPVVLNGLRAARASADAAGVVLAVKSGGLGLIDLALAPAMLSLTTLLAEGTAARYVERAQARLRAAQAEAVAAALWRAAWGDVMTALPAQLRGAAGVDDERLAALAAALGQAPPGRALQ